MICADCAGQDVRAFGTGWIRYFLQVLMHCVSRLSVWCHRRDAQCAYRIAVELSNLKTGLGFKAADGTFPFCRISR